MITSYTRIEAIFIQLILIPRLSHLTSVYCIPFVSVGDQMVAAG
jgi:hypothetical protein